MNERYPWQEAYDAAVLETDDAAMAVKIQVALAAIEQRRLSPPEIDGAEEEALQYSELALKTLVTERLDSFEAQ
jgi:hypothetical protein